MEMATLATVAMVAGTAVSAGATIYQGIAADKAGELEAQQYRENAAAAELASEQDALARRKDLARTIAAQQALRAGSGVDLRSPTSLAIEEASRQETEADILASRYNFAAEAERNRLAARQAKRSGRASLYGGFIGGTGQLLSGASAFKE
jgi:hypothetical protein